MISSNTSTASCSGNMDTSGSKKKGYIRRRGGSSSTDNGTIDCDDTNSSKGSCSTKETKESVDVIRVRQQNARLTSEMDELRLELAYYKGEVKRLDWDNQCLTKEVDKLSAIFNGWLNSNCKGNVVDNPYHLSTIIKLPPKHILEVLKCKQNESVVLASCQPPFHIEYASKCWSEVCGWGIDDILGLTCAFLQGEDTDMEIVNAFTKDIKQTAYARMRIHNYDRRGAKFATTVTVFPIYDSIAHTGPDSDIPVLTHFCAVHSDVVYFSDTSKTYSSPPKTRACEHLHKDIIELAESKGIPIESAERLSKASRFSAHCSMDASAFLSFAANIRLSDLLRFMLTCESPLVLFDSDDLIVHVNIHWTNTFGYALHEVEGFHKSMMYGPMTSDDDKTGCDSISKHMKNYSKVGYYYTKNGQLITCSTGTAPIIGGYLHPAITHFCTMFVPVHGDDGGDDGGDGDDGDAPPKELVENDNHRHDRHDLDVLMDI